MSLRCGGSDHSGPVRSPGADEKHPTWPWARAGVQVPRCDTSASSRGANAGCGVCAGADVLVAVQTWPDGRKLALGELPACFTPPGAQLAGQRRL